jgi:hypothetical protein
MTAAAFLPRLAHLRPLRAPPFPSHCQSGQPNAPKCPKMPPIRKWGMGHPRSSLIFSTQHSALSTPRDAKRTEKDTVWTGFFATTLRRHSRKPQAPNHLHDTPPNATFFFPIRTHPWPFPFSFASRSDPTRPMHETGLKPVKKASKWVEKGLVFTIGTTANAYRKWTYAAEKKIFFLHCACGAQRPLPLSPFACPSRLRAFVAPSSASPRNDPTSASIRGSIFSSHSAT